MRIPEAPKVTYQPVRNIDTSHRPGNADSDDELTG
jgi:hypothetical protein